MKVLAKFATTLRADSLLEDLDKAGIGASFLRPRWTEKRLPPPMVEVSVKDDDYDAAKQVLEAFNKVVHW